MVACSQKVIRHHVSLVKQMMRKHFDYYDSRYHAVYHSILILFVLPQGIALLVPYSISLKETWILNRSLTKLTNVSRMDLCHKDSIVMSRRSISYVHINLHFRASSITGLIKKRMAGHPVTAALTQSHVEL